MRKYLAVASLAFCASAQAQFAVGSSASGRTTPGFTPGSFVSAYGTFTGVTTTQASTVPFPTTLGGVTVSVGGTNAPLYFVQSGQINFIVPAGVAPGVREVRITSGAGTQTSSVRVVTTAPGIFTQDQTTPPKGAIRNQDSNLNTQDAPARRGQVIQIFGTGPGPLSAAVADGAVAPSSPLVTTVSTPQVFIGGVEATVQFSGLTPGSISLWQVNAVVPDRPFLNGRLPVVIFVDGVDSNEVAVFVAQ